jgi:hypothetical protein
MKERQNFVFFHLEVGHSDGHILLEKTASFQNRYIYYKFNILCKVSVKLLGFGLSLTFSLKLCIMLLQ